MAVSTAELKVVLSAVDNMSAGIKDAEKSLSDLEKSTSGLTNALGLAVKAAAGVGVGIAAGLAGGVKAAGDLQQSVANISTIKPDIDTSEVFKALNDMSTRVPQSSKQLGDSLYNVFSSIETTQTGALTLVEKFAQGAVGAQTDAETFGTAVLGVMNAYGLSVDDASHISDVFFNTVNKGVVTGDELARNLGLVTQSAKMAGVPLDELGGFIAGVTKEGGPAAQNINNLNNFLLKVTTKDAQKELNNLGVATVDATGKFRDMPSVLTDLKGRLDTMTEAEKTAALQKIFPDLQARAGANVLISQLDFVKGAIDENKASAGSAASAFEKMNATFNSQVTILGNTLKSVLVTVGAEILPAITPIVTAFAQQLPAAFAAFRAAAEGPLQIVKDAFATMVQVFRGDWAPDATQIQPFVNAVGIAATFVRDQLLPAVQNLLGFLGDHMEIVIGFGAALLALVGVAAAAAAIAGVAAAIAFLISPIGLVITAIGVLTAAWIGNWGDIQGKTQAVVTWFQSAGTNIINALNAINATLVSWLNTAGAGITAFLTTIGALWSAGWLAITTVIQTTFATIQLFIQTALTLIGDIILIGLGLWYTIFVQPLLDIYNLIVLTFTTIMTWFNDTFWTPLTAAFSAALVVLGTVLNDAWTAITTTVTTAWTAISTWFMDNFWTPVTKTFTDSVAALQNNILTPAWTAISQAVITAWTAISNWFRDTFWTPLVGIFTTATQALTKLLGDAWAAIRTAAETAWNGIKTAITGILDQLKGEAAAKSNDLKASVTGVWNSMAGPAKDAAVKMMSEFLSGLKAKGQEILSYVGKLGSDIVNKLKGALKINSPSKELFDLGANAGEGLNLGLQSKVGDIQSTMDNIGGAISGGAATAMSGARRYFSSVGQPSTDNIAEYIAQAAQLRGIDPTVALTVANSEGGVTEPARRGTFATGSSWWPFQLHYGGTGYEYLGNVAGMGNSFTAMTGWAPGDPNAWKDSVDYALDVAAKSGWGQWYGAAAAGIGNFQGISRKYGGMIPGALGQPQLAMVHGGEMVLTPGQQAALLHGSAGGGGLELHVHVNAPIYGVNDMESVIISALDRAERRGRF